MSNATPDPEIETDHTDAAADIDWNDPPVDFSDGWVNLPVYPPDRAILGMPGAGKTTTLEGILRHELGLGEDPDVDLEIDTDRDPALEYDDPTDRLRGVVVSTFRKAMADEVAERVGVLIGDELPNGHWIRTTHSICYKLLGIEPGQVVSEQDKQDFCADFGVPYQKSTGSNSSAPAWFGLTADGAKAELNTSDPVGNQLFDLRSFAINTFRDPATDWRSLGADAATLVELNRPGGRIKRFNDAYQRWKSDDGKVDFDDMLWLVWVRDINPPASVLIEDEFQDKTPLQIGIYNQWANAAKRVIVAGDPYQAIYGYAGCDPRYLVKAADSATETTKLSKSWRYGPDLWNFATPILTDVGYSPWDIDPVGDSTIHEINWSDYHAYARQYADQDVMHLGRTNWICSKIAKTLDSAGVPFEETKHRGSGRWTTRMVVLFDAVADAYQMISAAADTFGQPRYDDLSVGQAQVLLPALPADWYDGTTKKSALATIQKLEPGNDDHQDQLPSYLRDWFPLANLLPLIEADTPFNALLSSYVAQTQATFDRLTTTWHTRGPEPIGLIASDHVGTITQMEADLGSNIRLPNTISTIHGAKGREADVVFLVDRTTGRIDAESDRREEARVWFVGATRARHTLFVVRTNGRHAYRFPASAPHHTRADTDSAAAEN